MGSMASIVCSDLPLTYPRQSCDSCSSLYTGLCCHVHVQSICGLSSTFSFHFLLLSLSLSLSRPSPVFTLFLIPFPLPSLSQPLPLFFPPHPPIGTRQVLELACARESDKVYDAGALPAATSLLIHHASSLHRDTVQSCMNMVTRLVPRVEPKDSALEDCVASLSQLLQNSEPHISDPTLKCFMMLADRFIRRGRDPAPIAENGLLPELIGRLKSLNVGGGGPSSSASSTSGPIGTTPERPSGHTVTTIVSLLSTLCRGSPTITNVG